jgi:hypothetical protein
MTTYSLKNDDNGNNDDNWEEDDEEEYGASLNDALLSSPPSVPSALELAEVPLLTSPHLSDTPIFVDMIEQWVGVSNAHGGRDLSAVYDAFLPGQPPVDLGMATMFEGSVKKLYGTGDPLLLPEWIDLLNSTEGWKW